MFTPRYNIFQLFGYLPALQNWNNFCKNVPTVLILKTNKTDETLIIDRCQYYISLTAIPSFLNYPPYFTLLYSHYPVNKYLNTISGSRCILIQPYLNVLHYLRFFAILKYANKLNDYSKYLISGMGNVLVFSNDSRFWMELRTGNWCNAYKFDRR